MMRRFGSCRFARSQVGSTSQGAALDCAGSAITVAGSSTGVAATSGAAVQAPKPATKTKATIASKNAAMRASMCVLLSRSVDRLLVERRRLLEQHFDLPFQRRDVLPRGVPDDFVVDAVVIVGDPV